MKTPTINSRILKLEVLKDTATRTSVNAVESRTTSLEGDVATAQGDISTLQTDVSAVEGDISTLQGNVATLTQGIQDAVSTHNTAPDSHADLRTLIGDRALSMHQHARTDLPWISDPGAALLTAESASAQRTALGMTAWAVAPWTDGTTSDIPEGTQLYFTNARADARIAAQKGQAEGIMPLDSGGKAPLAYMPDALIGQVKFKGVWDAATNSPVLPSATTSMGHYYVTSVAGSYGGIDYGVGDWCISDGTAWGKVDNSDAITSFAGRVGAILPISSDYSAHYLGLHAQADDAARLGGQLPSYYAQAGHVHTFAGLTSKPTTLAGYGITDAAAASHTHSGYETAIGNPSANGYLLSSTSEGVRSWVAPYSHPATHAQSVIDSSSGWITTELAGKQAAGSYLTTTGTAADSEKLGGVAASGYSQSGHVHNYAGSSTPGGAATYAGLLEPISGPAGYKLGYAADGARIHPGSWGRVVMRYDANAETYGVRVDQADMVSDPGYLRIAYPGGGVSVTTTNQRSGAIAIRLPVGMSDTMFCVTVKVYDYAVGESFECHVSGYNYLDGKYWLNATAYIVGNPITDRQFTVRLGYDSIADKAMIYVGELSSVWNYPQVYITEVLCGFLGYSEAWASGWQISFEAEAFKAVTATVADCQVGLKTPNLTAIENLAGTSGVLVKTAANTWELKNGFTGAKVIGETTLNFVNGLLVS